MWNSPVLFYESKKLTKKYVIFGNSKVWYWIYKQGVSLSTLASDARILSSFSEANIIFINRGIP